MDDVDASAAARRLAAAEREALLPQDTTPCCRRAGSGQPQWPPWYWVSSR